MRADFHRESPRILGGASTSTGLERDHAIARRSPAVPAALDELGVSHPIAHDSYLINLASPNRRLWRKSVAAFVEELRRAEILGIPYVVTHPGAYTAGSEAAGLRNIVRALDEIHAESRGLRAQCLLETTAGQGTTLGWRFEQLAEIIDGVKEPDRLGVCFDTCHVFAAGYALGTPKEYEATMAAFDRLVGLAASRHFTSTTAAASGAAGSTATNTSVAANWGSSRSGFCWPTPVSAMCPCIWKPPRGKRTGWIGTRSTCACYVH